MRTSLIVVALVGCVGAACAGGGPQVRPALSASAQRALQQGLSPAARQSLAATITRQQQLQWLQTDAGLAARLSKLGISSETQVMSGDPWSTGVVVTPLAPLFPANATYQNYQVSLETRALQLSAFTPLPAAGQNPPVMWLSVGANYDPLFWLKVKWPKTGAYMVTLMMRDLLPTSIAKPRVQKSGTGMMTPIPNKTPGGDCWSLLWEVSDPNHLQEDISVFPAESGFGFTCCCVSKVVITRLY